MDNPIQHCSGLGIVGKQSFDFASGGPEATLFDLYLYGSTNDHANLLHKVTDRNLRPGANFDRIRIAASASAAFRKASAVFET